MKNSQNNMTGKLKYYLRQNSNLNEAKLDQVVKYFKLKHIKRNTILLSAGEICKEFYFINKGIVRVYYITEEGKEKTRHIGYDGSFATALSSFISQQPSFEFVDTLEDTELFSISHSDFQKLTKEITEWDQFYKNLLEMAYVFQNKKMENRVTLSAKQRYQIILNEAPMYVQRLSNKILAS
ncbi:MAG TPA: cyclic nucleotide-binding domain-containing protein, partial [Cyclobacteriaceae bacterium]